MLDLSKHIEYLLLTHQTVHVPQLGAFRTRYEHSRWNAEENVILPPFWSVCFDKEYDKQNLLFVETIAEVLKIDKTQATLMVSEYVDSLFQELRENNSVEIGSLGILLYNGKNEDLLFVSSDGGAACPFLYGLDSLHLQKIEYHASSEVKSPRGDYADAKDKHFTIRIPRKAVNYTIGVAVSVLCFFAFSHPLNNGTPNQTTQASLFAQENLLTEETPSSTLETSAMTATEKLTATNDANSSEKGEIKENLPEENLPEEKTFPQEQEKTAGYAVVVASAVSEKNASLYAKELRKRNIQAEVRLFGDMRRVIIPGYGTLDEAHEGIKSLRQQSDEFEQAWALKL